MENVGCLLDAKRECACSVNGRVRECMTFEWNAGGAVCLVPRERVQGCAWSANGTAGGAVCRVSADIACIAMCVCGGGGGGGTMVP